MPSAKTDRGTPQEVIGLILMRDSIQPTQQHLKGRERGFGDIDEIVLTRLDYGFVINGEKEGGGKDDLEFSTLVQESNRRERICDEERERERKYSGWNITEIPDSVSNWKLWSEVKTKGQDKKELSKTLIFKLTLALSINSIRA